MPTAGFEPAVPSNQRPQTYVLDSAAVMSTPNTIDFLIVVALYIFVVVHGTGIP
jgi:hypothetical protein